MIANAKKYAGFHGFSYARFSDPSQGEGHSIERQEQYAPQFCEEFGLKLNELSFRDEGRSAFKGEHLKSATGQLSRFLACVDAGYVKAGDFLIVENLDRLSRLELSAAEQLLHSILSRGVRIHTRSPWAIYDQKTLNNPMERMQMIFEFTRSHRESRAKQERLSRRWEHNRQHIREGDYHLALIPAWLKPVKQRGKVVAYEPQNDRVAVVRQVFQWCIDGQGLNAIVKRLNAERVPTFGRANSWARSSVAKLLSNRAVLGEYQPFTSVKFDEEGREYQTTKRVPAGDPVKNHFPQIINAATFQQAALAMQKRRTYRTGRSTAAVTNLFAGLLRDARDGSPLHVIDKGRRGSGSQIVSGNAQSGATDASYLAVPYIALEQGFIAFLSDLPLAMITPKQNTKAGKHLAQLRKDVEAIELQVAKVREKLRKTTSDALLDLLVERDNELKEKRAELETLERLQQSPAVMAAKSSQAVLKHLSAATGEELLTLRAKLRSEMRYWLKQITILPLDVGGTRCMLVDAELADGRHLQFRASRELVNYPPELEGVDICNYVNWPAELKRDQWDTEQPIDERIRELDDKRLAVEDIAAEVGLNASKVSRRLIAMGRRRAKREVLGKDRQMTWVAGARGWQRIYQGKRYYVGCGTLKKLYPRLVKSADEAGTLKAANRWWTEHGAE